MWKITTFFTGSCEVCEGLKPAFVIRAAETVHHGALFSVGSKLSPINLGRFLKYATLIMFIDSLHQFSE